jgi:uncharacterized lipoprotein YmbA
MSEYKNYNYTRRADLITNLVKQQESDKLEAEKQQAIKIQRENQKRWQEHHERILQEELAANFSRQQSIASSSDIVSSGGPSSDYMTVDYVDVDYVE